MKADICHHLRPKDSCDTCRIAELESQLDEYRTIMQQCMRSLGHPAATLYQNLPMCCADNAKQLEEALSRLDLYQTALEKIRDGLPGACLFALEVLEGRYKIGDVEKLNTSTDAT